MTQIKRFLLLVAGLWATSLMGCAFEQTTPTPEDEVAAYQAQKSGNSEALDELGWSPSHKLTSEEEETLNKRVELKKRENELKDLSERDQYFKFKPYLDNDEERLKFLDLPNTEARDRYAMEKGIYFRANKYAPPVRDAVSRSDIILGMGKEAVIDSWGEPTTVEVAGQEQFGNERWRYVDYVETPEGYEREERSVYFENGKVAGWKKN